MDPVAALRPWPIDIELGEWEYTVPARSAAEWLVAVLDEDGAAIVPGLFNETDRAEVFDAYAAGLVASEDLARASRDVLEAAAGRPWWEADRLIRGAAHPDAWAVVSGELVGHGIDLERISIAAYCNAVYAFAVRNADADARQRLDFEIRRLPIGVDPDELYDADEEERLLMADLTEFEESPEG